MDTVNCTTYTDITGSPICKSKYKYKMATTMYFVSQKFDKAKIGRVKSSLDKPLKFNNVFYI